MAVAIQELAVPGPAGLSLQGEYKKVLSRRVFLAERLLRAAVGTHCGELRSVLSLYWTLPGAVKAQLCREPLFSYGVNRVLYRAASGSLPARAREYVDLLAGLIAEAHLRADNGLPIGEPVPVGGVSGDRVELPNYPGYVRVRRAVPSPTGRLASVGLERSACAESGEHVLLDAGTFAMEAARVVLPGGVRLESGRWYRQVGGEVLDQAERDEGPPPPGCAVPGSPFLEAGDAAVVGHFTRAMEILRDCAPLPFGEVQTNTTVVVPIRTPYATGFTVDSCRGAVFVTPEESLIDTIDHLVHESAHNKLHTIEDLNRLLQPMGAQRFASPWRTDPRPMSGLVHGAYVFTLVGFALAQIANHLEQAAAAIRHRVAIYHGQVAQALDTIEGHAKLTPAGAEFALFLRNWHAELGDIVSSPAS